MLAALYLIIAFFVGWTLKQLSGLIPQAFYPNCRKNAFFSSFMDIRPSFFIDCRCYGHDHIPLLSFLSVFPCCPRFCESLLFSNLALIPLLSVFFFLAWRREFKKPHAPSWSDYFSNTTASILKHFFLRVFQHLPYRVQFFCLQRISERGATVFSDFAPHTR